MLRHPDPVALTGDRTRTARFLVGLDASWTRFETIVAVVAVAIEVFSMSLWVLLKGLSTPAESESHGGIVARAILLALGLGLGAWFAGKRAGPRARIGATVAFTLLGVLVAPHVAAVGVQYTSNLLNWYQQGSVLTLVGGLRGIGTRLNLILALVGGSLATARGKHIVLDVTTRLLRGRIRWVAATATGLLCALVTAAAAWGFFDHVSIEDFDARADMTARQKVGQVFERLGEDGFIIRSQLALDFKSMPHIVFRGEPYADWLKGAEWNRWVANAGFDQRYGHDATLSVFIPDDESRAPLVVIPGRGEPRGELTKAGDLIVPIGLLIIALRFVLRVALVSTGAAPAEPDASDDALEHAARS